MSRKEWMAVAYALWMISCVALFFAILAIVEPQSWDYSMKVFHLWSVDIVPEKGIGWIIAFTVGFGAGIFARARAKTR